ncbi:hypothetical protein A0H81_14158 [Grifola frondosa]|uniref:Uncharacterized protein n=1 Tax=Grifola frondosa TaxID=5627 RepID=A0A1C7LMJ0_GRIFR|nr:hypothetical protein A0H81_14158 [Grifola frondosa]
MRTYHQNDPWRTARDEPVRHAEDVVDMDAENDANGSSRGKVEEDDDIPVEGVSGGYDEEDIDQMEIDDTELQERSNSYLPIDAFDASSEAEQSEAIHADSSCEDNDEEVEDEYEDYAPEHEPDDHEPDNPEPEGIIREFHADIDGRPCDKDGVYLAPGMPPTLPQAAPTDDWTPYRSQVGFEMADLLYKRVQMAGGNINALLNLWAASVLKYGDQAPFANVEDLYRTIDSTILGDVKWESFKMKYSGDLPDGDVPSWMKQTHEVWFRDPHVVVQQMLANPDFNGEMDYAPV